ncbi:hypothetical protein [Oerskovia enterophila]|uniref:hypothetical protein n=1 Tax=Oerskovia enterophila TaxID=43678 RepID=UPI003392E789
MAEYTPTTDFHMRTAFVTAIPRPESGDVWDRWQATHDEAVRQEVRERIAQDIEVKMRRHDAAQVGFSAVGDAYAEAARIARGATR